MEKITTKDGYKVAYRPNTPDEIALLACSFVKDKSVDPFYKIKNDDIIIMIGSYIGFFSIYAASKVTEGKVYSIEPNSDNYRLLRKNIELNNVKNIIYDNVAIGKARGKIKLYLDDNNVGHTITREISDKFEEVNQITLENFFEKHNIANCDLLKINCEGAEFEIIENIDKSIMGKIKNMIISYHIDKAPQYSEKLIINKLKKNNYKVFHIPRTKGRGWIVAFQKPYFDRLPRYYYGRIIHFLLRVKNRLKLILKFFLKQFK